MNGEKPVEGSNSALRVTLCDCCKCNAINLTELINQHPNIRLEVVKKLNIDDVSNQRELLISVINKITELRWNDNDLADPNKAADILLRNL